jgi:hydrogenase nickel incorporation protein HypA/HybF
MHETSIVAGLMTRLSAIRNEHGGIVAVKVRLGALSQISPGHFREHFERAARGTELDGVRLEIESSDDLRDPQAQEIVLDSVEVDA